MVYFGSIGISWLGYINYKLLKNKCLKTKKRASEDTRQLP